MKVKEPSSKSVTNAAGKLGKPAVVAKNNDKPKEVKKEVKEDIANILDMDFGTTPTNTAQSNDNDSGWTNFDDSNSNPSSNKDDLFSVFDTKQNNEKTENLIKSLGDLYGQSAQPQFPQFPQYPQYPQYPQSYPQTYPQAYPQAPMPATTYPPGFSGAGYPGGFSAPKPTQSMPPTAPPTTHLTSDDPFASVIEEQKQKTIEEMKKAQTAKMTQQSSAPLPAGFAQPTTGITPNMFFQQMMNFMQNANQSNPSQSAMMMAAMQQMMSQMTVGQAPAQAPETAEEKPFVPEARPDPNQAMFKNLFNDATSSTFTEPKRSSIGSKPHGTPMTFSSPPAKGPDMSNPFGGAFSSSGGAPQSNNLFDTQFTNSGFTSGGSSGGAKPSGSASTNPFDLFK